MKKILLLTLVLLTAVTASASSRKLKNSDTEKFQYELEGVNNGSQGSYLVKVWSYSASKKINIEICKKNAVHGIIFKGYEGGQNVRPQRALVTDFDAEVTHADFFEKFFMDGGEYNKYVKVTMGSQEVIKVGKKYKVGLIVSVSKDALRKVLEKAGVVKPLGAGF